MIRGLAALWLTAATLAAAGDGVLAGLIQDRTGAAMVSASVTAMDQETGIRRSTHADGTGAYEIAALPPGQYKLTVRKPGFQTIVRWNVAIGSGQDARLDFAMQVGSMHEVITIEGGPNPIHTEDGSVGTVVGRKAIETLPINGRGVMSLVELSPGIVATPAAGGEAGQFSANGLRANTNYFTIDGVSANSGVTSGGLPAQFAGVALPAMTAFGSTHNLVSQDALDEVHILTSSFAPQYGRLPGAQVALTTRSGSNEYHGSVFYSLRNEALDANDWFANASGAGRGRLRLNQRGASLGGPLRRDRTFFFASYEGLHLDQPYTQIAATPSPDIRTRAPQEYQSILNGFPLPTGSSLTTDMSSLVARYSRPSHVNTGSLRIDHALSERVNLFGRYNQAPSDTESGFTQIERLDLRTSSFTLGVTALLPSAITNDFRTNIWSTSAASQWRANSAAGGSPVDFAGLLGPPEPASSAAFYGIAIGGVGALYSGQSGRNHQKQWNLVDTLSFRRGAHDVRLGIDYQRLTPVRDTAASSITGTWNNLAEFLSGTAPVITTTRAQQASALIETLSVFAQDTWNVSRRLTLIYGLRWELTPPPAIREPGSAFPESRVNIQGEEPVAADAVGTSFLPVAATSAPLWNTRYTQLAPRVGAAFRLDDHSVLRAGWGKFYDLGFSTALDPINGFPFNRWHFDMAGGSSLAADGPFYGPRLAPDLRLPYAFEWNVAYERAFTLRDILSLSYVGSSGHDLLRYEGIPQPGTRVAQYVVATNQGSSNYHALEAQYRRRLGRSLQGTVSYTWSHAIDTGSWDSGLYLANGKLSAADDRGSSSFDVRHNLTAGLSYAMPRLGRGLVQQLTGGWEWSGMLRARSGFPIDVKMGENLLGLGFDNVVRPDLVPGVPIWLPAETIGGRRLNPAAFAQPAGPQGNLGRNAITGAGMWQVDLALKRAFSLTEQVRFELGVEAYNAFNHANAADPVRYLDSPYFGTPVSMLNLMLGSGRARSGLTPAFQIGGPRSFEVTARFRF